MPTYFKSWLRSLKVWLFARRESTYRRSVGRRPTTRLFLEHLEDRLAPATYTPLVAAGDGNVDSLRYDINLANNNGATSNTINLAAGTYALSQHSDLSISIAANRTLSIIGAGASQTIVNAEGLARVFEAVGAGTVTFQDLSITGGLATDGGSVGGSNALGGGILNNGATVRLINVAIAGNTAQGGAGAAGEGGGVFSNGGSLTLQNTIIGQLINGVNVGANLASGGTGSTGGVGTVSTLYVGQQGGTGGSGQGGAIGAVNSTVTISGSNIYGKATGGAGGMGGAGGFNGTVGGGGAAGTGGVGGTGGSAQGGGIFVSGGSLTVSATSFLSGNALGSQGGQGGLGHKGATGGPGLGTVAGSGAAGGAGGAGGDGQGAALFTSGSTINLSGLTIQNSSNTGGAGGTGGVGGIGGDGGTGNRFLTRGGTGGPAGPGGTGGNGGGAMGGGFYSTGGSVTVTRVTFQQNLDQGGAGGTGGLGGKGGHGGNAFADVNGYSPCYSGTGNCGTGGNGNSGGNGGTGGIGGTAQGGGMYVNSAGTIFGSLFYANTATGGNGGIGGHGGDFADAGHGGTVSIPSPGGPARYDRADGVPGSPGNGGQGGQGATGANGSGGLIFGNTRGGAQGGGIYVANSDAFLVDSTVDSNAARAGAGGPGGQPGAASPFGLFLGHAGGTGGNGLARGGGIYVVAAPDIHNLTITSNTATTDGAGLSGKLNQNVFLTNTIVSIENSVSRVNIEGSNNLIGIDPKLGPLQNNGGPTLSRLPLSGSPAIDTGLGINFPNTDQRGYPRTLASKPTVEDIGAVELQYDLAVTGNVASSAADAGGNITYTFTVTNNGPDLTSPTLTDVLPANTTFVSMTIPNGWSKTTPAVGANGTASATIGSLASGGTATITLVVKVNATTTPGTVISNTASVTRTDDTNTANNTTAALTATVGNPVPTIGTLGQATQSVAFALIGTNFVPGSVVKFNNVTQSSTFINSTRLLVNFGTNGTGTLTVTNPSPGGGTATMNNFTIQFPPIVATGGVLVTGTENVGTNGRLPQTLATFTSTDTNPANFTVTVDWGNGTVDHSPLVNGNGTFTVKAWTTYSEDSLAQPNGVYTITITIHHNGAPTSNDQTVTSAASIAEVNVTAAGGSYFNAIYPEFTANEGVPSGLLPVAWFYDSPTTLFDAFSLTTPISSHYSAVIDWGDGATNSTTDGTGNADIHLVGATDYLAHVRGNHTYGTEGTFTITTTVFHDTSVPQTATFTVIVAETAVTGTAISTTANTGSNAFITVATFTDPVPEDIGEYSATIDWGDSTATSSGVISYNTGTNTYSVQGSHNYTAESQSGPPSGYHVNVTILHNGARTDVASTLVVSHPPVEAVGALSVPFTEGVISDSGTYVTLATFTDPSGADANVINYGLSVNWGDGQSDGDVRVAKQTGNLFNVLGRHKYGEEGTYTVTVTVSHRSAFHISYATPVNSTAVVADAIVTGLRPLTFTPVLGVSTGMQNLAYFDDPGNPYPFSESEPNLYAVSVDWGDHSAVEHPAVQVSIYGLLAVQGSHTYTEAGKYTITTTLLHGGNLPVTVSMPVQVAGAPSLEPFGPTLPDLTPNDIYNTGDFIHFIVGDSWTLNNLSANGPSIAVIGTSVNVNGGVSAPDADKWQFSNDFGAHWNDFGDVSASAALLLRGNDWVRFLPDGTNGATASFSYVAWDESAGQPNTKFNITDSGGTTAFSFLLCPDTCSVVVAVPPSFTNDPPPTDATLNTPYSFTFSASGFPDPTLSATGLPAWLTFDPLTGILAGTPTAANIGDSSDITITASNGHSADANVTFTLAIPKLEQTISFGALAEHTYGDAAFTLSATASSLLPVSFAVLSGPASVVGNQLTITGAGDVTIEATQLGDTHYGSAAAVDQTFTVNAAPLTLTADDRSIFYGQTPNFTVTPAGFVNGDGLGSLGGSLTISGDAAGAVTPGTYTITPGGLTSDNYAITFKDGKLVIKQAHLTVSAVDQIRLYGQNNAALTYTLSGFVNDEDAASAGVTGTPVLSTVATANSPVAVNPYTITVVSAGTLSAANYDFPNLVNGGVTVNRAHLLVTAVDKDRRYGQANPTFTYTITGFVNSQIASTAGITGSPALSTAATPASPVANCPYDINVDISGLAAANYDFQGAGGHLAVNPATLTISPAAGQSKLYGAPLPTLTYTPSGFANSEPASLVTGALGTTATAASPVTSYAFTLGSLSAGTNYTLALAASPPTFAVTAATLTIAPTAGQSKVYGAVVPTLGYTPAGLVNGDSTAVLSGALGTLATASSPVANYAFTLGTLTAGINYTLALTANSPLFSVTPATLTVTANNAGRLYGVANPTFTASYSGFVNGDKIGVVTGSPILTTTATPTSAPGNYDILVNVSGLSAANYTFSPAKGTLSVSGYPLSASGVNFQATAGAPFTGSVATFTNADPYGSAASYLATITWGDGSTSPGVISGAGTTLTVTGSHTYADPVNKTVSVQISHKLGYTTTATTSSTATVVSLGLNVQKGQTGGMDFWRTRSGQTLIQSFNGGASSTALANWLAATFPNVYGTSAGANNLTGKTNTQMAAIYLTKFAMSGPKVDAEVLATALSVYATTSSLGGTAGVAYGFIVNATGLGARSYNVGTNGAAFGVADRATLNVYQLLQAVNKRAVNGVLYNGNITLRQQATNLFDALNKAGTI